MTPNVKINVVVGPRATGKTTYFYSKSMLYFTPLLETPSSTTEGKYLSVASAATTLKNVLINRPSVLEKFAELTGLHIILEDTHGCDPHNNISISDVHARQTCTWEWKFSRSGTNLQHTVGASETAQSTAQFHVAMVLAYILNGLDHATGIAGEVPYVIVLDEFGSDLDNDLIRVAIQAYISCIDEYLSDNDSDCTVDIYFITHNGKIVGQVINNIQTSKYDGDLVRVGRNTVITIVPIKDIPVNHNDPYYVKFHEALTSHWDGVSIEGRDEALSYELTDRILQRKLPWKKRLNFIDMNGWHRFPAFYDLMERLIGLEHHIRFMFDGDALKIQKADAVMLQTSLYDKLNTHYRLPVPIEHALKNPLKGNKLCDASTYVWTNDDVSFLVIDGKPPNQWNYDGLLSKLGCKKGKTFDLRETAQRLADIVLDSSNTSSEASVLRWVFQIEPHHLFGESATPPPPKHVILKYQLGLGSDELIKSINLVDDPSTSLTIRFSEFAKTRSLRHYPVATEIFLSYIIEKANTSVGFVSGILDVPSTHSELRDAIRFCAVHPYVRHKAKFRLIILTEDLAFVQSEQCTNCPYVIYQV